MTAKPVCIFALVSISIATPARHAIAQNDVTGCSELVNRIHTSGVIDDKDKPHKDYAGWTNANFVPSFKFDEPQRVQCPKGCGRGKVCFEATAYIKLTPALAVRMLNWIPAGKECNPSVCKIERHDWQARLEDHEKHHEDDAASIAKEYNEENEIGYLETVCLASARRVKAEFTKKVRSEANKAAKGAASEFYRRTIDFHKREEQVPDPDCINRCPEAPACKECPAGKILFNAQDVRLLSGMGECLTPRTPCGPEVGEPGKKYYQNCGLQGPLGQQERVECCNFHQPGGPDIWACNPAPYGSGGCAAAGPIYH